MLWSACGDGAGPGEEPRPETFSFEDGLEGWSPDATDILVGEDPIDWSVTTTAEAATDGERSTRLTLDNLSDAGKIWIERRFELEPETSYDVRIEFDFGTSDFGFVNLWTVIAGASSRSPETAEDLESAFQDETGHGQDEDLGLVWMEKSYDLAATSGPDGAPRDARCLGHVRGHPDLLRRRGADHVHEGGGSAVLQTGAAGMRSLGPQPRLMPCGSRERGRWRARRTR